MRNIWLALLTCSSILIAAKRDRDWQTGRVVEASMEQKTMAWGTVSNQRTALVNQEVYSIEAPDKSYLISGPVPLNRQKGEPTAGTTVSFAVEGQTMFIQLSGKEHRFHIERVTAAPSAANLLQSVTVAGAASAASNKLGDTSVEALDNDAIVNMTLAELKPDTIVKVIETRPGRYVLTPPAVAGLKAAGVSQHVIAAMFAKTNIR